MKFGKTLTCIAITASCAVGFGAERTIEASFSADQVEGLRISNGVGDFDLEAADVTEIRVQITLTPRRGGIFSSMKRAEEEVEKATLVSAVEDHTLRVELEVGVGTVSVVVPGGNVGVSVGVGNGTIRGSVGAFGSADASGGVGGAVIEAEGEVTTGEGFVSHSSSWRGDGPHSIELEVGVGDAKIVLD